MPRSDAASRTVRVEPAFAQRIRDLHGPQGDAWLAGLPRRIQECEARWGLEVGPPFEPLSYNYVAAARRADRTAVVLKAGLPGFELRCEIEALRLFDGRGAVRLLAADVETGALVLE